MSLTPAGESDDAQLRQALLSRLRDWWTLLRIGARPTTWHPGSAVPRRRQDDRRAGGRRLDQAAA